MKKDKYISVQVFAKEYFLVDICNINYCIAENLLKTYYHPNQINQPNIKRFKQLSGYSIYQIVGPDEFFYYRSGNIRKPNYNMIKCLNEETFEKFIAHWFDGNNGWFTNYYEEIKHLKENYKKYLEEAMIRDIIE